MNALNNFFKLLSDETRMRLIVLLYHKELCVSELTEITGISQPNVSKHLGRLRDMNIVKDRREEQFIFYSLNIDEGINLDIIRLIVENINNYELLKQDLEKSEELSDEKNID